jgi:hypothetical protein
MDEIIERLRMEKAEVNDAWREQGRKDGLDWAKVAEYEQLLYAAIQDEPVGDFSVHGFTVSPLPTRDDYLGENFESAMEDQPELKNGVIWKQWEEGWLEAVRAFWEEVSPKL